MSETVSEVVDDTSVLDAPVVAAPGVGAQLRAAREAKQMQVADVAQTLKLGPRQVEALENGDWQGLPGHTFIRGFVRNYARLVNVDPAPLMAQLDGILHRPVNSLALPETKPATVSSSGFGAPARDRLVMVAGGLLVAIALLVYLLLPNDLSALRSSVQSLIDSLARKEAAEVVAPVAAPAPAEPVFPPGSTPQQVMTPQALTPADNVQPAPAPASTPAAEPVAAPTAAAAPISAAPLRFVVSKESWIEVRDRDDKVVFSQRSPAASEQSVNAPGPLSLVIGYAPGVKLYWRGQLVDLAPHTRADVARLVLE